MAEMVPSVLLYGQALELIKDIQSASKEETDDVEDLLRELAAILVRYEDSAGKPLVEYESVAETEPPSSEKSNRFWRAAEKDINLLQQQMDILRAATLFSHNAVVTEIENAYNENAKVGSKLKTLQLYSDYTDRSIVSFGDSFKSLDFIDIDQVASFEQPTFLHEGYVTLGRKGELVNLSKNASVRVLEGSNGFVGNNQEIIEPSDEIKFIAYGDNEQTYTFTAEAGNPNDLGAILDGEPNTWMEYEAYKLTKSQKFSALNMNFEYIVSEGDSGETETVSWADGPSNNVLKLGLEFDIGQIRNLNSVELTPYGLEGNKNYPVKVRRVQTSPNRTDWTTVFPTDVNIGSEVNLKTAAAADNVITRRAVWVFEAREVRYVRVYMEQPSPIPSNVGHIYWINRSNGQRVEGPNPPIDDLDRFMDDEVVGDFVQRREYFDGKRWAIGIRDVDLQQAQYVQKSVLVTNPLRVGGVIDRVILKDADIQIPDSFPEDSRWVRFYISPDEGENWYPIARIEDVAQEIPEQISFNDPLHESLREGAVKNYTTDNPVTSVRLKVELRRPSDNNSMTPVLHGYTLKVKRR